MTNASPVIAAQKARAFAIASEQACTAALVERGIVALVAEGRCAIDVLADFLREHAVPDSEVLGLLWMAAQAVSRRPVQTEGGR